jgi:tetratricopeptide (TPR) repeat protein
MISRVNRFCVFALLLILSACTSNPAENPPELLSEADTLISNGVAQYNLANYAKATILFEQAMYVYRSIDNPGGIASAYINLAKTAIAQHDLSRADYWLAQTQSIVDTEQLTVISNHISIIASSIAIEQNDFDTAKNLLTTLLAEENKTIDAQTRLAAVQNRTRIAFAENKNPQEWTARFAKLASDNNPQSQARLARFNAALGKLSKDQDAHYQQALTIYRKLAWRPGLAATLTEWAEQNVIAGNHDAARNKLERALLIRLDLQDNYNTALVLQLLGNVYASLDQPAKQQRAANWQQQISNPDFYDWDKVMKDFESS